MRSAAAPCALLLLVLGLAPGCGPAGRADPWTVWRDEVHSPSELPGLGWELVPGIEREVAGVVVRANSQGARDEEPTPGAEVFRLAALGGCFTFGWGIDGELSWPRRLERELTGSLLVVGREVDFLDLAVCGHGASQQLALLEHRALAQEPWIVVVEHSLEDPAAAHVAALRSLAGGRAPPSLAQLHDPAGEPWAASAAAYARVRELCAPRGIPVVLLIVPRLDGQPWEAYPYRALHRQVAREGRRHGFAVLDLLVRFEAEPPAALLGSPADAGAPSARAQELAADAVKRFLYSSQVLARALEGH